MFVNSPCNGNQWFEEAVSVTASRVRVTINGDVGTEVFEVEIYGDLAPSDKGYDDWKDTEQVDDIVDPDPDNDGRPNLLEYATGGDPMSDADVDVDPVLTHVGGELKYRLKQRSDDANLSFKVQTCTDLSANNWVDTDLEPTDVQDGTEYDDVTYTIPSTVTQTYVRLKVTNQ